MQSFIPNVIGFMTQVTFFWNETNGCYVLYESLDPKKKKKNNTAYPVVLSISTLQNPTKFLQLYYIFVFNFIFK